MSKPSAIEGPWWAWSHGQSGNVLSSSDDVKPPKDAFTIGAKSHSSRRGKKSSRKKETVGPKGAFFALDHAMSEPKFFLSDEFTWTRKTSRHKESTPSFPSFRLLDNVDESCISTSSSSSSKSVRKRTAEDRLNWETCSNSGSASSSPIFLPRHEKTFDCDLSEDELLSLSPSHEVKRERMLLGDTRESYSPDDNVGMEEKGLALDIRYQLPIALGTSKETELDCAICQVKYNVGDHLVTLSCEHFFHASCVDKWLWHHTSCPLCRTEVTLKDGGTKHAFKECSAREKEATRQKLRYRYRAQASRFRPLQVEQISWQLDEMKIDSPELCCPQPTRIRRNNAK